MPKQNTVTISLTNSKLGGQIPSINLPPVITCRKNAPCSKLCYAQKGNFCYSNVKRSHIENLKAFQTNPTQYFQDIKDFLSSEFVSYKLFRFHSAGDIVDDYYFGRMVKLALELPAVKFLAFTKKFEIVNNYVKKGDKIPDNLKIVFSAWDKNFKFDNPYNFPITYVAFKDKSQNPQIPPTAIPCAGKCYKCIACWGLEKGQSVVFKQH